MKVICDCGTEMTQVNCHAPIFAEEDCPMGGRVDEFVCSNCGNSVNATLAYHVAEVEVKAQYEEV